MSVDGASLWRPWSPCGTACLSERADGGAPGRVRVARLLALFGVLLLGVLVAPTLGALPGRLRPVVVGALARAILRGIGVRLAVRGRPPRRRALLVANHVSWLDAVALVAVSPAVMLAKAEVRGWPLIGLLARAAGSLFLDRRRPRALPATVAALAAALRAGRVVAVFPEGTTFCGTEAGGFRPALFQAAIDADVPVAPATIRYHVGGPWRPTTVAAFVGDEPLWRSLCRVVAARELTVSVTVAPALHPGPAATRRSLARAAQAAVGAARPVGAGSAPVPVVRPTTARATAPATV